MVLSAQHIISPIFQKLLLSFFWGTVPPAIREVLPRLSITQSNLHGPKEALLPPQADPTDSSKNWYLERRNTWHEGHWNKVIEKAGPKEMFMSFSLELSRFLSFSKPVCSSSPLVLGATQYPSCIFSLFG